CRKRGAGFAEEGVIWEQNGEERNVERVTSASALERDGDQHIPSRSRRNDPAGLVAGSPQGFAALRRQRSFSANGCVGRAPARPGRTNRGGRGCCAGARSGTGRNAP